MNRYLALLAALALAACTPSTDETATVAVSDLKVDLAEVAKVGKVVPVNGMTSAGQPNAAQFEVFADSEYAAVIDIRLVEENRGLDEPRVVEGLGMEYVSFPIGRGDITIDKARELGSLLDGYDQPVLVHCGSANRVGALLALKKYDETGDVELALETGREGGMTRLEGAVRQVMEQESN